MINVKSAKYFIPNGIIHDMDKIKKKAVSHGVLGLLLNIYHSESTEYAIKRLISTKILAYVETQDFADQLDILKAVEGNSNKNGEKKNQKDHATPEEEKLTPKKLISTPNKVQDEQKLSITGNNIQSISPRNVCQLLVKGIVNTSIQNSIGVEKMIEVLEKYIGSLEVRQKSKTNEESKKKKSRDARKFTENDDKKGKRKR